MKLSRSRIRHQSRMQVHRISKRLVWICGLNERFQVAFCNLNLTSVASTDLFDLQAMIDAAAPMNCNYPRPHTAHELGERCVRQQLRPRVMARHIPKTLRKCLNQLQRNIKDSMTIRMTSSILVDRDDECDMKVVELPYMGHY